MIWLKLHFVCLFVFVEVNDIKALPYHGLKKNHTLPLSRRAQMNKFLVDNSKNEKISM